MITACPHCHTAFRISEQQLGARNGQVRCGRCQAVFDARESLRGEQAETAAGPHPGPIAREATAIVWPTLPEITAADPAEKPAPAPPAPEAGVVAVAAAAPAQQSEPDAPFAAAAPARARRGGWIAGSVVMLVALLGQAAFHFRGEISILFPESRPVIADLCARLDCDIPLPRRTELMSIESSDLQAAPSNPSVMVLSAILRNRAPFPQSPPALELTLTDAQDQALARRVLTAREYLGPRPGFDANSEVPVRIYFDASSVKATGYRLYLFHP